MIAIGRGKGHIPGLACEDRKNCREFGADWLPGNSPIKKTTVKVKKPNTGTDWRI